LQANFIVILVQDEKLSTFLVLIGSPNGNQHMTIIYAAEPDQYDFLCVYLFV
jgi:hypothetical protein